MFVSILPDKAAVPEQEAFNCSYIKQKEPKQSMIFTFFKNVFAVGQKISESVSAFIPWQDVLQETFTEGCRILVHVAIDAFFFVKTSSEQI